MNVMTVVKASGPVLKKALPYIGAAATAVMKVMADQKTAGTIASMQDRINDLEKIVKK